MLRALGSKPDYLSLRVPAPSERSDRARRQSVEEHELRLSLAGKGQHPQLNLLRSTSYALEADLDAAKRQGGSTPELLARAEQELRRRQQADAEEEDGSQAYSHWS